MKQPCRDMLIRQPLGNQNTHSNVLNEVNKAEILVGVDIK